MSMDQSSKSSSAARARMILMLDMHTAGVHQVPSVRTHANQPPKVSAKNFSKSMRRKSYIPAIIEAESSESETDDDVDSDEVDNGQKSDAAHSSSSADLATIDQEFSRLLPFVTAGLRNIGRVGAEPVWEMLAERLDWNRKAERKT